MDIFAIGGSWGFALGGGGGFKYSVDKKSGDLSLVLAPKAKYKRAVFAVNVPSGVFLETVNADGEVIFTGGDGDHYYIHLGKKPMTLRYKRLPDPKLTTKEIDKERQNVTRCLFDNHSWNAGEPDTLIGLIAWAEKLLAKIPEKYRKAAVCRFDTSMSYGETYPHVEVSYEEPETDKEVIARVQIQRERARLAEMEKRTQFEKLKSEFAVSE